MINWLNTHLRGRHYLVFHLFTEKISMLQLIRAVFFPVKRHPPTKLHRHLLHIYKVSGIFNRWQCTKTRTVKQLIFLIVLLTVINACFVGVDWVLQVGYRRHSRMTERRQVCPCSFVVKQAWCFATDILNLHRFNSKFNQNMKLKSSRGAVIRN